MRDTFLGWVKTLVRGTGDGQAGGQAAAERERSATAALYTCPTCETTYVAEVMASCPECGQPVESIPNERDLGLT